MDVEVGPDGFLRERGLSMPDTSMPDKLTAEEIIQKLKARRDKLAAWVYRHGSDLIRAETRLEELNHILDEFSGFYEDNIRAMDEEFADEGSVEKTIDQEKYPPGPQDCSGTLYGCWKCTCNKSTGSIWGKHAVCGDCGASRPVYDKEPK